MGFTKSVKYYPSRVKAELKKYGKAYVQKKYGLAVYAKVTGQTLKKTSKGYVISKRTGDKLDYVHNSKTSGKKIYAKDEDHKLHSHMLGHNDMHKPGVGGIDNKKLSQYKSSNPAVAAVTGRSDASKPNKPPKATSGWKGPRVLSAFVEGGMADLAKGAEPFKRQMNFNLSNDEDLAQGSEHPWAQATSISHLISGQLRQASNQTVDAWEQWAQDKSGTTEITRRGGSPFGVDMNFTPDFGGHSEGDGHDHSHMEAEEYGGMDAGTQLAQSNPMGAFGTSKVMYDLGEEPDMVEESIDGDNVTEAGTFGGWKANELGDLGFQDSKDYNDWATKDRASFDRGYKNAVEAFLRNGGRQGGQKAVDARNAALQKEFVAYWNKHTKGTKMTYSVNNGVSTTGWEAPAGGTPTGPGTDDEPYKQSPLPMYNTGENGDAYNLPDNFTPTSDVYNPWAYGEGGEYNMMGPSSARMGQATMEAMALANAYFAPQRAELAYELGDMETDMRRLSANLGRQVDDPVLQAKLYKEASRAVRTLDIQQNTYAFQMADARRKEELSNWQFYDQLAQNEHQMRLANYQFMKTLDLQYSQYNLQNWQAQYAANQGLPNQPAPPSGGTTEASENYNYGSAKSVSPTISSKLGGIYGTKRY